MKFVKATTVEAKQLLLKNHNPLTIKNRECVCVHADTDS